jgi:uncharacterized membrane protein YphA (DoxX/SURF4 family)
MSKNQTPMQTAGLFFIRILLGIIFFMQGYGKIFTIGVSKVYAMFFKDFENTFLPKWLIIFTAYYTSYIEFIGGFLLIIGLLKKYVMYLLALDLLIVSFGHGLMESIWDLSHLIPCAILLASLFLLPAAWDKWQKCVLHSYKSY